MHPTNNDGFGKPNAFPASTNLGVRICCTQTVWGFLRFFSCSQTRTWGYLNRSDSSTGIKKKWTNQAENLNFQSYPFGIPNFRIIRTRCQLYSCWVRFIPYTLGKLTYPTTMEGGKNQTSSPKLPEILVHVILPRGKTRITFISTNGWSRHFHRRSARYAFLRSGSAFTCSGRVIPGKYFTFSWVFVNFKGAIFWAPKKSRQNPHTTHTTHKKKLNTPTKQGLDSERMDKLKDLS